ncbi:MjaII restriction endonuclease [Gloeomargarita lithophora Alchichica-D10]|uniref:type II site-specific deoxyribonuclease n=1 Tax=Gloeomargarita lithophora Alchichica-D10 TaxID=1188229 RepID=A0A1J0ACD7_9CYAN|nr:TdeIII family type II restriction endonuclease [Gloeomargarita lithophora]APB33589.1 MjaII restriction endonuclease [Gloeomargarita lithophora Alchichica-D10]
MKPETKQKIKKLVSDVIINKLNNYSSETEYRPFYDALFEKQVIAQASILHSFYTTFGVSIYEPLVKIIGENEAGYTVLTQYDLQGYIDQNTETLINQFCLSQNPANKKQEIAQIRQQIKPGTPQKDKEGIVDIFLLKPNNEEVYIDIASAKMNLKEFRALRRKILRWCALRLSQNPHVNIRTCIGFPYNPYHPARYKRWTSKDCDNQEDLLIQEKFWQEFSGGNDIFEELIEIFKEVGDDLLRNKISDFLKGQQT